jgi:hypothetical protein
VLFGTTTTFNDGNWHQAAMVVDQAAKIAQIYVDGVAQPLTGADCGTVSGTTVDFSSCSHVSTYITTEPFAVGALKVTGVLGQFFIGSLDELRVYNSALNSVQIMKLYLNDNNPSPVGYWKFNEATGTSPADFSGNGFTGTLSTTNPTTTTGQIGNALTFNGSSNYVNMGTTGLDFTSSSTNSFTIMSWFNTSDSTTTPHRIVSKGDLTSTSVGYFLDVTPVSTCVGCVGGSISDGTAADGVVFSTTSTTTTKMVTGTRLPWSSIALPGEPTCTSMVRHSPYRW